MIYVTHDQVEAMTLGQRIVVMDRGVVRQIGPPEEVYQRPQNRFVAGFLGTPPMNFVEGKLERRNEKVEFVGGGLCVIFEPEAGGRIIQYMGRPVVFGIRPEDITPVAAGDPTSAGAASVSGVEFAGERTTVQLELAGGDNQRNQPATVILSTARLPAAWRQGDRVGLVCRPGRSHVFDAVSGENLSLAGR